ncbi:Uncharacterised protein [Mycobacteroides abscessus subsp. abscessus]|nr:Uncharacterised protein [Mycobacteroides abscessus subsp. abscessus]
MIGSSKYSVDNVAIASDPTETATSTGHERMPVCASKMTSTGQCHRYHEYDTRPRKRSGASDSRLPTSGRPVPASCPATMTSPADSVGSSAAVPG